MDERTFFEALAAAPDDPAPMQIYADVLMERGDSMAEYLELQAESRARPLDRRRAQRAQDLLIINWKRWMGPMHGVLNRRRCTFEGGFLREAEAQIDKNDPALRDAYQWATVRALKVTGSAASVATALESPWLRNLKRLRCDATALRHTRQLHFTLDSLELKGDDALGFEAPPALQRLAQLELRECGGPLAQLALSAGELFWFFADINGAIGLVQEILQSRAMAFNFEGITAATVSGWRLRVTRARDRIVANTTSVSNIDEAAIRELGEVALEVNFAENSFRGLARDYKYWHA
jgi:uncharacterized protein (TIGR02996 family)